MFISASEIISSNTHHYWCIYCYNVTYFFFYFEGAYAYIFPRLILTPLLLGIDFTVWLMPGVQYSWSICELTITACCLFCPIHWSTHICVTGNEVYQILIKSLFLFIIVYSYKLKSPNGNRCMLLTPEIFKQTLAKRLVTWTCLMQGTWSEWRTILIHGNTLEWIKTTEHFSYLLQILISIY